jgi:conjugal transfer ATP-binding protein TraC
MISKISKAISKALNLDVKETQEKNESGRALWQGNLDAQKKLLSGNKVADLNCVLEYIEDYQMFIMEGGYIGFVLACQPTNGVNDEIRTAFEGFLTEEFPNNTLIQLSLAALPRIDNFLNGYMALRKGRMGNAEDSDLADAMSESVVDYYSQARKGSLNNRIGIRPRDFEHWVTVKIPVKNFIPTDKELKEFVDIRERTYSIFEGLGLAPEVLDDTGWLTRMQTFFNHSEHSLWRTKPKINKLAPLGSQILERGNILSRDENGLAFDSSEEDGEGFATVMTLKQTPEYLNYGDIINLLGDWRYGKRTVAWNPYIMTLNIQLPSDHSAKEEFNRRNSWLKKQAKGKMLEWVSSLKDQVTDYNAIEEELKNSRLCKLSLSMVVLGEDKAQTVAATRKLQASFRRKEYKFTIENVLAPSVFLNSLPLGLDDEYIKLSDRFDEWTAKGAVFLTPHSSSWKGNTPYPVLEFVTRFGQVFGLDIFSTDSSYNALICARSGAGKSFFNNKLITSYLGSGVRPKWEEGSAGDGAQVFVIDKGRSYENLASQYEDAQFIDFNENMKFSLDPFASIDDFYGKEGQAAMVHSLLKAMASESGELNDFQATEMLTVLTELWDKKGPEASITDYSEMCQEHEEVELRRIGRQLKPWCDGGIYGDFFGKKYPPVNFSSRLIVCEMDELSSQPHLSQCVLMSLINAAQHAMFLSGDKIRKLFILDEAWEYLKDKPGKTNYLAEFLETGWRRFRKTRAAGICITQSLLDAYQSQAGMAIVNNSPWKFMLAQEREAVDKLKEMKAYDGTEQDYDLMKSVHTVKGQYSEILVRYGESREVVKLFVDKQTQLVYSTDADDRTLVNSFKAKGFSIKDSLNMAHEHKNGK